MDGILLVCAVGADSRVRFALEHESCAHTPVPPNVGTSALPPTPMPPEPPTGIGGVRSGFGESDDLESEDPHPITRKTTKSPKYG